MLRIEPDCCHSLSKIIVRVISGKAKGHTLFVPKGLLLRPTSDQVKETLYNIIASDVPGATVLDAFAGTGNIGIEALSRGAARAVFIEKSPAHVRVLRRNLTACHQESQSLVYCGDVNKILLKLQKTARQFDLVYLDPPYRQTNMLQDILAKLIESDLVVETGMIIVEHAHTFTMPATPGKAWKLVHRRDIGDTALSFYRNQPREHL